MPTEFWQYSNFVFGTHCFFLFIVRKENAKVYILNIAFPLFSCNIKISYHMNNLISKTEKRRLFRDRLVKPFTSNNIFNTITRYNEKI